MKFIYVHFSNCNKMYLDSAIKTQIKNSKIFSNSCLKNHFQYKSKHKTDSCQKNTSHNKHA